MRLIKRYPNRKLYDTHQKQYVTLHDIAGMIREGHEVQVTDHGSGEDLTAITLTQIIFEQEKRQAGFLPRTVLRGLVEAGGERLSTLRRALASPLGLSQQIDEEIDRRIQTLIRRGALEEDQGLHMRDMLMEWEVEEALPSESIEVELERALGRLGVPRRSEVREMNERLDKVLRDLDVLLEQDQVE